MRSSSRFPVPPSRLLLLAVLLAGCSAPAVLREGEGWRETESSVEVSSDDPAVLAGIARTHPDARVRAAAIGKISDAAVLADLARSEKEPALRKAAVDRLDDEALLDRVAREDADPAVQAAARARRDVLRTVAAGHVEYASWASRKPGAWVQMKLDLQVGDRRSSARVARKLVSCRPDRAVFEQSDPATGRGPEGLFRDLLQGYDLCVGRTEEDAGDLEIAGKRERCRWKRWMFTRGRDIVRVRRWFHDSVPGGVARIDLEVAPLGDAPRTLTGTAVAWGP